MCSLSLLGTGKLMKPGQEVRRVDDEHVAFPITVGVAGAARRHVRRVSLGVRMDRAPQIQLAVEDDDVVAVLLNAVDRAVECPVEDDVGRLALEARIVLRHELRRRFLTCGGHFGSGVHAGSGLTAASTATATAAPGARFSRLRCWERAQRHERAAAPARIGHHDLLGRPVAADVWFTARTTRRASRCRSWCSTAAAAGQGTTHFLDLVLAGGHVLPVPIHVRAVRKTDRVQVAGLHVGAIGRRLDRDRLTDREQLFLPAGTPQRVRRPHLAAMLASPCHWRQSSRSRAMNAD